MVKKLNEEVIRGMSKPAIAARMQRDGMITQDMTPERLRAFIADESKAWGPIVQQVGLAKKK
jgi:tripartite-type tricarboxylate transporter receptor subunit TctC